VGAGNCKAAPQLLPVGMAAAALGGEAHVRPTERVARRGAGLRIPQRNERWHDPGGRDPSHSPPLGKGKPAAGQPWLRSTRCPVAAPALMCRRNSVGTGDGDLAAEVESVPSKLNCCSYAARLKTHPPTGSKAHPIIGLCPQISSLVPERNRCSVLRSLVMEECGDAIVVAGHIPPLPALLCRWAMERSSAALP
jgi:hypothetical protein